MDHVTVSVDAAAVKRCCYCEKLKPANQFTLSSAGKTCDHCTSVRRAWKEKNREKLRQQEREWVAKNPERKKANTRASEERHRQKRVDVRRDKRRKNPEPGRVAVRAWRKRFPERVKQYSQKWEAANIGKRLSYNRKRQARKMNATIGDQKPVQAFYEMVQEADRMRCYWCGKIVPKGKRTVDHIVALVNGGAHSVLNLCCACGPCNFQKEARAAEEFSGQHELFVDKIPSC